MNIVDSHGKTCLGVLPDHLCLIIQHQANGLRGPGEIQLN